MTPATDNRRAIMLMLGSMALFAVEDVFLKRAAMALPPGQVIALQGVAGGLLFWAMAAARGQPILVAAALRGAPLLRALSEAGATMLYIVALAVLPLSVNSALLQASPLVVTMGAALFLGERVGWRRWTAIGIGFVGVLVILQPWDAGAFRLAGLLTVGCVVILAARDLATRAMPAEIGTFQLTTWAYLALVPAGLVLMALMGERPAPLPAAQLTDLALAVLSGMGGYYAITLAMRLGEVAVVAPFRYSRLVFAAALGMAVFGERPEAMTWAGAALIIGSGLYAFARARVQQGAVNPRA